jgi:hypothetical protein
MKTNIIKASVKGILHIKNKIKNQDYAKVKSYKQSIIAVVCDGLGSHKFSHIGSKQACHTVIDVMKKYYNTNIMNNIDRILNDIHKRWLDRLKKYNPKESGTTCLFTYIVKDQLLVCQLGDGAIFVDNEKAFQKDKRLYANETHSLTKTNSIDKWNWKMYNTASSVMLCTDGVSEDLKLNKIKVFNEWLFNLSHRFNKNYMMKKELKNWPNKANGDDKSIIYISIGE